MNILLHGVVILIRALYRTNYLSSVYKRHLTSSDGDCRNLNTFFLSYLRKSTTMKFFLTRVQVLEKHDESGFLDSVNKNTAQKVRAIVLNALI